MIAFKKQIGIPAAPVVVVLTILTLGIIVAALNRLGIFHVNVDVSRALAVLLLAAAPFYIILLTLFLNKIGTFAAKAEAGASRDALTNLFNQKTFWDVLGHEIERSKRRCYRFSLLVINLDNFKTVNDLYGHKVGDAFLASFAHHFCGIIRKVDIPVRYGGDNFAAILPVCDEAEAYSVADRLLDGIRQYFYLLPDGNRVRTTVSIGAAVYPDHAHEARDLFLIADSMMAHAKSSGKDRLSVPSDDVDLMSLKNAGEKNMLIMNAIREDRFVPYFQPIVSADGRTLLAYEILTRIDTGFRVITAAEFIETAESMGAIRKMDYLLIERSMQIVAQSGYLGTLFFNLSPKALVLKEFVPTIRAILARYAFDPSRMVFEITERETVKNLSVIEAIVRALKQEGFRFAIDDFGSGYSSFQYIKMFKVDYLKIDGEFIRSMTGSGSMENTIVENIARLSADLGIKTIAEYVESGPILQQVQRVKIDYAQGYHIQRPAPHLNWHPAECITAPAMPPAKSCTAA